MKHVRGPLCSIDVGERTAETEEIDDVLESYIGGVRSERNSHTIGSRSTPIRWARTTDFTSRRARCNTRR